MSTASQGRVQGAVRSLPGASGRGDDRFLLWMSPESPDFALAAIADGMGGHGGGGRAAETALAALEASVPRLLRASESEIDGILDASLREARRDLAALRARSLNFERAGTTLTCAVISHHRARVRHVGDSRLWRRRAGRWDLCSEDHSVAWRLYREGVLSPEERDASPLRHRLYRFLGRPDAVADEMTLPLQKGDALLFLTDGCSFEGRRGVASSYNAASMISEILPPSFVAKDDATALALVVD
jgi:PPM family protein phosphatase